MFWNWLRCECKEKLKDSEDMNKRLRITLGEEFDLNRTMEQRIMPKNITINDLKETVRQLKKANTSLKKSLTELEYYAKPAGDRE